MEYLGQPWEEDRDCYYWFRRIQEEVFARLVPPLAGTTRTITAARYLRDIPKVWGWTQTETPREGDAVFLAQRIEPHHIGTVVRIGNKQQILHAVRCSGVVLSDQALLRHNGWRIYGYWTKH